MSKKFKIIMPTADEDAAITAAALSDPDAQPLTDAELAQFKPARNRGRPPQTVTKIATSLRLDPDVLDAFKQTGPGWQTRINEALAHYAASHELSRETDERTTLKGAIEGPKRSGERVPGIKHALSRLKKSLCPHIDVRAPNSGKHVSHKWKAHWRSLVLREAIAWRVHDLLEQSVALREQEHVLGARILLRSAFETLAILIYLNQAMRSVTSGQTDFHRFSETIEKLFLGSRAKSTLDDSMNFVDVLNNADYRYPGLALLYTMLSESAHPHKGGVLLGYSEPQPEGLTASFENKWAATYGKSHSDSVMLCLETFHHEYGDEFRAAVKALEQWIVENDKLVESTKPS